MSMHRMDGLDKYEAMEERLVIYLVFCKYIQQLDYIMTLDLWDTSDFMDYMNIVYLKTRMVLNKEVLVLRSMEERKHQARH